VGCDEVVAPDGLSFHAVVVVSGLLHVLSSLLVYRVVYEEEARGAFPDTEVLTGEV
jgi:hypothetical protein